MRKLYRSTRDRKIFGICGGLSDFLGVDATLLRILLVVVTVFSAGSLVFVYLIAGFIIPQEPTHNAFNSGPYGTPYGDPWNGGTRPGPTNYGWTPPAGSPPPAGQGWSPGQSGYGGTAGYTAAKPQPSATPRETEGLDAMMEDIEKKALRKELEELKARIAKFEEQSKGE
ncbi:PspC domain-containing protein [Cohnella massiliensis]|uniref:PspC domain-containing protein n=1 Tax=Cohnella massiliensis TaxID=1816691 RepID=UPI0009BC2814|nr:PspC domain-containing protein [Cohnella massiliensis]